MAFGGRRGGLCLLWNEPINVFIKSSSLHHIDAIIASTQGLPEWRFTGLYGWTEEQEKFLTWQLLRDLNTDFNLPWLCMGDMNEITSSAEKECGIPRAPHKMIAFRSTLEVCDLRDLGFSGNQFTWTNAQCGISSIQERLDRAMANPRWSQIFPRATVDHLVRFQSDHCPLMINGNPTPYPVKR